MVTATADYTGYDVEKDELETIADYPFTFFYSEDLMDGLSLLGTTITNETKTYGGLSRDCRVLASLSGYSGEVTIDAATGLILEMAISSGDDAGSFKLIAWEDQDLEAEYKTSGGIPGYGLSLFGLCAIVPIVYMMRKFRK